jgi:hypothetical protein
MYLLYEQFSQLLRARQTMKMRASLQERENFDIFSLISESYLKSEKFR